MIHMGIDRVIYLMSWVHADLFAASISVRVYPYVCATDMGIDVHACIMSALTCDLKREKRNKQREREIQYSYEE